MTRSNQSPMFTAPTRAQIAARAEALYEQSRGRPRRARLGPESEYWTEAQEQLERAELERFLAAITTDLNDHLASRLRQLGLGPFTGVVIFGDDEQGEAP